MLELGCGSASVLSGLPAPDFEERICTEVRNKPRVQKEFDRHAKKLFTDLHYCFDESRLAMHKFVAQCDCAK